MSVFGRRHLFQFSIQSAEGVQYREVLFTGADAALISGEIRLTHSTTGTVYTLYLKDYTYAP